MNPERIQAMMSEVVSHLQYIQASQVFQCILDTSVVHPEMEDLAQITLDNAILLKLRINQVIKALDELDKQDLEDAA